MALTNIVRLAQTLHDTAGSSSGGGMPSPVNPAYAYDGDPSTAYGNQAYHGGGGDWGFSLTNYSTHTFSKPYTLTSIYYRLYTYDIASGNYPNGHAEQYVQIQYNYGPWVTLWAYAYGANAGIRLNEYTQNGLWTNVTGLQAITVTGVGGDRDGWCGGYIYEIQGWGQVYTDIGIQYYKGGVKKIGVEPLTASHKLRVYKNGVAYGIPLLDPSDSNASAVRIFDGSAVKSLPKAT